MEIDRALALVELALGDRQLSNAQEVIFTESWSGRTYAEIAGQYSYDNDYIRDVGAQLWQLLSQALGEKITKRNFKAVLGRLYRQRHALPPDEQLSELSAAGASSVQSLGEDLSDVPSAIIRGNVQTVIRQDWEEAPQPSFFCGREAELETLRSWIVDDRCRSIGLFGLGGIGKTAIALECVHQLQGQFESVLWQTLRNAPPLDDFLSKAIQFLSDRKAIKQSLPLNVGEQISHLIRYLQQQRCLLILDNAEAILKRGERCGRYRPGYEDYGELFKQIGEQQHQSCLILTSREKPLEFSQLEGERLPVRALQLNGLPQEAGQAVIQLKGTFSATTQAWKALVDLYSGNPLALKIAAAAIQDLFEGEVDRFLKHSVFVFDDINDLLDEQFNRLSKLEQQVMYWLAIEREPIAIDVLAEDILQSISKRQLFETLKSLVRRSLIYRANAGFTQQPVIMEYLVERLQQQIAAEIISDAPNLLVSLALMKVQAKEYIAESQQRVLVAPIAQELRHCFNSLQDIENKLKQLIHLLREQWSGHEGYSVGNILNLMQQLDLDLSGYDLSGLSIRHVDLQKIALRDVNLQGATLDNTVFADSADYYFSVAIGPKGTVLATGGAQGSIAIWDFPHMATCQILPGHSHWINQLAFSPNGQLLASASFDGAVKIWQIAAGQCIATFREHTAPVASVAFSPDGKTLVSAGHDGKVILWDVQTWTCIRIIQEHPAPVGAIAFSPDGTILASGLFDGHLVLYNLRTLQTVRSPEKHEEIVWSLAFHPDGQSVFTGSYDRTIKVWDSQTGQCLQTLLGHLNPVVRLACCSNSQVLASASHDRTIRLWEISTGRCLQVLQGHQSDVVGIDFSPDGDVLVSTSLDRSIKLWDVKTGLLLKTFQSSYLAVWSVAFSPDGSQLISGGEDRKLRLWDVNQQTCIKTWSAHINEIFYVAFHPAGQMVSSGGSDCIAKLWDVASGQCCQALEGARNSICSVAFSPDGRLLATAGRSLTIHVWEVATGQCLQELTGKQKLPIWSVAFSHDGQVLAGGSYDATIKLWNAQTWQRIATLVGHKSYINSVCFSPKDRLLASGGYDAVVKIWDARRGECLHTLPGHQEMIWAVTFSPDANQVASASTDRTVKLWDVQTGDCLKTLEGHQGMVSSVSFHPSQQLLASSSHDGTIRLWDLDSGQCVSVLTSPKLYEGLNISGANGLTHSQRETLFALGAIEKD